MDALKAGITKAWADMSSGKASDRYDGKKLFKQLSASMSVRFIECIKQKGNHIKIRLP